MYRHALLFALDAKATVPDCVGQFDIEGFLLPPLASAQQALQFLRFVLLVVVLLVLLTCSLQSFQTRIERLQLLWWW